MAYKWADAERATLIDGDGRFIPAVEGNRDFQAFLASGETAAPWKTPEELDAELAAAAAKEARRAAIQARLESLIAELNAKYSIELSASLSVSEASALLLAAGAAWADCNNIKLLYDTINTMGGIKA